MAGEKSTESRFVKLVVDGKIMKVSCACNGKSFPKDISDKLHLKGIEIMPATADEFMEYYINKYGAPVITG